MPHEKRRHRGFRRPHGLSRIDESISVSLHGPRLAQLARFSIVEQIDERVVRHGPHACRRPIDERRAHRAVENRCEVRCSPQFGKRSLEDRVGRIERFGCRAGIGGDLHIRARCKHQCGANRGQQQHGHERDDQCSASFGTDGHRAAFSARGATTIRETRSGTNRFPRAVPLRVKSGPAGPRRAAMAASARTVMTTSRTRSRSASYRFGFAASGHHGPSVSDDAVRGTSTGCGASVASLGTIAPPALRANAQFSPMG